MFRQGLVAPQGRKCDLGPEGRDMVKTGSSAHVVLRVAGAYHAPIGQETHLSGCSDGCGQLYISA